MLQLIRGLLGRRDRADVRLVAERVLHLGRQRAGLLSLTDDGDGHVVGRRLVETTEVGGAHDEAHEDWNDDVRQDRPHRGLRGWRMRGGHLFPSFN